ncbi:hypothetical protein ACFX15_006672 [Malus domestica]
MRNHEFAEEHCDGEVFPTTLRRVREEWNQVSGFLGCREQSGSAAKLLLLPQRGIEGTVPISTNAEKSFSNAPSEEIEPTTTRITGPARGSRRCNWRRSSMAMELQRVFGVLGIGSSAEIEIEI